MPTGFLQPPATPPLYHDLLSLPLKRIGELEDPTWRLMSPDNLINAPGVRVSRAGFNNSGVSNNNRVVERHDLSIRGVLEKLRLCRGSVGVHRTSLPTRLISRHDGGEAIFQSAKRVAGILPCQRHPSFRLDSDAPINIVSNPAASDPTVRNGLSCIGCHTEGMKTFEDQVRSVIESNPNPPYNKAQALRLYVEKSNMDALLGQDMNRYREALEATGGAIGGVEPVSRFHEAFQGPVDVAYAAAVVGLQTETFLEKIRENLGLQNVGLLVLQGESGSVKRDA